MTVAYEPNPTAARRELALYFRALREQRDIGLDRLADHLGVTEVQASRIDRGVRGIGADDVGRLADWYGLDDAEHRRLVALSAESRKRGWWQKVDLGEIGDDSYRTLIGMEQAATAITEFASGVVPGLLQIPAYARAMAAATSIDLAPGQIDIGVDVRMRRQQILSGSGRPACGSYSTRPSLRVVSATSP